MTAFIGMGLLGSNFVRAMLKKGEQVQVWNRTWEKAATLEREGAKAFKDLADAIKGASRIHITLSDDTAVDDILAQAKNHLAHGVIIVDHTTTTASGAATRTQYWKAAGYTYIHAPVFMGPQNALESTGVMMISGDQELIQQLTPELSKMTGKLINFGTDTNKAAGMKLCGNLFLMSLTAGLSDVLGLAKALNIPASDIASLFDTWNPAASIPGRFKKMTDGQFDKPSWELKMARKDSRLMMEEAANGNVTLTVIPAIAAEMDKWIERGHGNDDWTVIAKDNIAS